jgi:dihydrofolate reductase
VAKLVYSAITSLDGYVADEQGRFDWSAPDAEVHQFVNDQERGIGTYLYGRRLYDVMVWWETILDTPDLPPEAEDYARVWLAADKIVYSRTLAAPTTARTRIERDFVPDVVRRMVDASPTDVSIGGAELAAQALRAGIVDELHLYLNPIIVGGGTPALPAGGHAQLTLLHEHRFRGGVVHVHYRLHR